MIKLKNNFLMRQYMKDYLKYGENTDYFTVDMEYAKSIENELLNVRILSP